MSDSEIAYREATNMLKEMFPSVDGEIVSAVLESTNGNLEVTIQTLLEMSDPSRTSSGDAASIPIPSSLPDDFLTLDSVADAVYGRQPSKQATQEHDDFELAKRLQAEEVAQASAANRQRAPSRTSATAAAGGAGAAMTSATRKPGSSGGWWDKFSESTRKKFKDLQSRMSGKKDSAMESTEYSAVSHGEHSSLLDSADEDDDELENDPRFSADQPGNSATTTSTIATGTAARQRPVAFEDTSDSLLAFRD
eukprot:ANDGO_05347.mRNA.1 hypothetical protein